MTGPVGDTSLTIDVLGPLAVSVRGRPVAVTASRLRALLAVLAMSAGEDVSVHRLAELVWGEKPPADTRSTVQLYMMRLRRLVGADAIRTVPAGYRLQVDPSRVDAVRFQQALELAATAADAATERARLGQALALWRGAPFVGVQSAWLEQVESPRLQERYLAAVERRIELDLAAGRTDEVVAELRELTARHPLRERLWEQLMTALYRSGLQADALAAYQRLYRTLADELGVEPNHGIRELHRRILDADGTHAAHHHDPVRPAVPDLGAPSPAGRPEPISQLPRDIADFTGRNGEADKLVDALTEARSTTIVYGIDGMAGAGKSALAVHVAHRVLDAYPDALLFVDLYGHTADRTPRTAAETLDHLLRVMGLPADQVPEGIDERVARWRTLTMNRRILILLDNAISAEQVRPVIPGGAGCSVVVTSRRRLTDLEPTHLLSLDPMPPTDAAALFRRTSGTTAAGAGVEEVLDLCGGLPLAIRIAGTRLRHRPAWSPAELAGRLRDQHRRLAELSLGDIGVAAAFSLSYQYLTGAQQRVFRALGVHPGSQLDARSIAAGCDLPVAAARTALEDLVDAHLLAQPAAGWYQLHDLLRVFASDQAAQHPTEREQTLAGILAYYIAAADRADRCAYPHRQRIDMPTGVNSAPTFSSAGGALEWFDIEISTLVAAARVAYERGMDDHAWRIPLAAWGCFSLRSRWSEWIESFQVAVTAAERAMDKVALGHALSGLGVAMAETAAYDSAIACYQRAIDLRHDIGDIRGQAGNLGNLAVVYAEQGRYDEAIRRAEQAAHLSRSIGDDARVAATITNLGEMRRRVGDLDGALSNLREALDLSRQISSSQSESIALGYLAAVHNDMKTHEQAADLGQRALHILQRTTNDQLRIADVLIALGHAAHGLADPDTARHHWQHARHILTDLGLSRTTEVQDLLDSLPPPR